MTDWWQPGFSNFSMAIRIALLFTFYCIVPRAEAAPDGISFGVGSGNDAITVVKAGIRRPFHWRWFVSKTGQLTGYWELSLSHWSEPTDAIVALGFSPVFAYEFTPFAGGYQFYIDGGIGLALLSDTRIGTRDLGSNFQFEDQVGVGVRIGQNRQHDLNIRFLHYSNAGFADPNDGIDILLFSYIHWLRR